MARTVHKPNAAYLPEGIARLSNLSGWEVRNTFILFTAAVVRCCSIALHMPRLLAVQKSVCLENKVLVILVPRTVVGVGIQDQLGIRHVLNEIKRIHCVNDDVVISAYDQRRLLDVLQISETLAAASSPLTDARDLR